MTSGVRVGIDLVEVDRFARALRDRPRLVQRMFTAAEIGACAASPNAGERLAARFAAKEAAFKALGIGWPSIPYHDVEVVNASSGAPSLVLRGRAAAAAAGRTPAVSISHAAGLAVAEVILAEGEADGAL